MLTLTPQHRIFICTEPVDFRKGIDSLVSYCKYQQSIDPMSGIICAFTNRRQIMVRLLVYDGTGFWLCAKRFSEGRLKWWPTSPQQASQLTPIQVQIILNQGDPRQTIFQSNWRALNPVCHDDKATAESLWDSL